MAADPQKVGGTDITVVVFVELAQIPWNIDYQLPATLVFVALVVVTLVVLAGVHWHPDNATQSA